MWDEITYPFLNFNLSMLRLRLIHVGKRGPRSIYYVVVWNIKRASYMVWLCFVPLLLWSWFIIIVSVEIIHILYGFFTVVALSVSMLVKQYWRMNKIDHYQNTTKFALTHLPLDKCPPFRRQYFQMHFCILIEISLKFVPKGPIDNNPALVQIMAWCRIGDKPLSQPMMNRFTDAYMWHWGEMS